MTLEAQIRDALQAQVSTSSPPFGLADQARLRGRRIRRMRAVGASGLAVLLVATGAALASDPRADSSRLITPTTPPTATPAPTPSATPTSERPKPPAPDAAQRAWIAALPLGREPDLAWTYGLEFHSPGLRDTFASGGWVVPLGPGGGGFVVDVHSDGDTGAGDGDKSTGVLTSTGFREIDRGDRTHGLSSDGHWLAAATWERSTYSPPTELQLFDTTTGRRVAHVPYAYDSAHVVSVSAGEVRFELADYEDDGKRRLVSWDITTGRVRELGPAPEPTSVPGQVSGRPFTFEAGVLHELEGGRRALAVGAPAGVTLFDVVHESADTVIAVAWGRHGQLGLIRCRFSTQSCERASALGLKPGASFRLDESLG